MNETLLYVAIGGGVLFVGFLFLVVAVAAFATSRSRPSASISRQIDEAKHDGADAVFRQLLGQAHARDVGGKLNPPADAPKG